MEERSLSLAAQVLLLSIDPADGGLVAGRRRLRKALRAAGGSYREALSELRRAGLVHGRWRLELVDRAAAGPRFRRLQEAIRENALDDPDEVELFVLLAWTGVVAKRLPRDDRRRAARRLRALGTTLADPDSPGRPIPAQGPHGLAISPVIAALVLGGSLHAGGLLDTSDLIESSGLFDDGPTLGGSLAGADSGGGDTGGNP